MAHVVIHSNPNLANQIESAGWLKQGFDRHGVSCEITADRQKEADIHVVQGPHYAFDAWYGKPNVIWLDRTFYGDSRFDLSIGWLNPDGSRDFRNQDKTEPNGPLPELKPRKAARDSAVVFTDYGQYPHFMLAWAKSRFSVVEHRPHPAEQPGQAPLSEAWAQFDVALGQSSTVLVQAAIEGLHVISFDPRHVVQDIYDRHAKNIWTDAELQSWLIKLSWAQWHFDTGIQSGKFWEHLCK